MENGYRKRELFPREQVAWTTIGDDNGDYRERNGRKMDNERGFYCKAH